MSESTSAETELSWTHTQVTVMMITLTQSMVVMPPELSKEDGNAHQETPPLPVCAMRSEETELS